MSPRTTFSLMGKHFIFLGLISHPMAALDEGKLKEILGVPDEMEFVIATPLGYPAEGSYEEEVKFRVTYVS